MPLQAVFYYLSFVYVVYMKFFCTTSWVFCALLLSGLSACAKKSNVPVISSLESLPGGTGSTDYLPVASFEKPVKNLPVDLRADFYAGKALANQPWIMAPATTNARDGLGPLFNARSCFACHKNGGKSKMPSDGGEQLFGPLVRISLPGFDSVNGVVFDPVYGDQLQTQSIAFSHLMNIPLEKRTKKKEVSPEAYVYVDWQVNEITYPDGDVVKLHYPQLRIENLAYGELAENSQVTVRNAPSLAGMGLLELIDQADIDALVDVDDINNDGISGRLNYVWDRERNKTVAGRFGLKANRHDLRDITAAAFVNDIGITSALYPIDTCSKQQVLCRHSPNGNDQEGVELPENLLQLTTQFVRNIGVPRRRDEKTVEVKRGRNIFYQTGCQGCHTPSFTTQQWTDTGNKISQHLYGQTIWPYSDLLLHDMGEGLSGKRTDFLATEREWRTPPLWGVGLNSKVNGSRNLLHDGRATSIEEAILWHGGEAENTKNTFMFLPKTQRDALLAFVESL